MQNFLYSCVYSCFCLISLRKRKIDDKKLLPFMVIILNNGSSLAHCDNYLAIHKLVQK